MSNEKELLFRKDYDTEDCHIGMFYERSKIDNKVLYCPELTDDIDDYEEVFGVYCPKCGTLHEYNNEEYNKLRNDYFVNKAAKFTPCESCGRETAISQILDANGKYLESVRAETTLSKSVPKMLSIATDGERINVSVILRKWGFNPKVAKPYYKDIQVTIVINTKLGQTYIMPAQWDRKNVFVNMTHITTVSLFYSSVFITINDKFFEKDATAVKALNDAFSRNNPDMKGEYRSLMEVARANYLGPLYNFFEKKNDKILNREVISKWKKLKRRYRKNPETFHQYLTYGCKEVATKSIRKYLYSHPDEKWTLRFLYKSLGFTNPDILRSLLSDESGKARTAASCEYEFPRNSKWISMRFRRLSNALREAGFTEKQMVSFFFPPKQGTNRDLYNLKDGARMFEMYESQLSKEDLRKCKTIAQLHDLLVETDLRTRNKVMWDRYHEEVSYSDNILRLEGKHDNADFKIIKSPWELKALGRRFHNCVGSYMEDVKQKNSIIVEMLINGKSEACIELDGTGKVCSQAFAACNRILEGDAAESFEKWTTFHGIRSGRNIPHAAAQPVVNYAVPF